MFEKVSFVFVFLGDEPQLGRLLLQWYLTNGMVYGLSGKGFYPRLAKTDRKNLGVPTSEVNCSNGI